MVLHIVTSHWKEDLDWLKKSKWPVVLIDKEGADPTWIVPQHVIPNKGKEASSYLKYIIENYDALPDHVAFIHGHETAWHQHYPNSLFELMECANTGKYGFLPLNNWARMYPFADEDTGYQRIESLWAEFEFPMSKPPNMHVLICPLGAQFIVARERILAHPLELWRKWYHKVITGDDDLIPTFLELTWAMIFGEPWTCRTQRDLFSCYSGGTMMWGL
jgi:hypothetical protein